MSNSPQKPRKVQILAIILISYVMVVLDVSVVLTGLPKIHHDLNFSDAGLAWVQSAYTLSFGGFLLLGARAGDILGRRRMFMIGMTVFTIASVAIGASPTESWMLAWRAIQGLGSAILAPATLALLQTNFDEGEERTRAVSYYSAAAGLSATAGLVVGGLLADWLSWRVGFLINLPIGVAMILCARAYIHETGRRAGSFDVPGALTSTIAVSALVYGFIRSAEHGWDAFAGAAVAGALLLLCAFVLIERRAAQPILPLRLFADAERSGAYACRALYLGAMVGFYFFATVYLQEVAGFRPAMTGLAFLPATIPHVPTAMLVPRLTRRVGRRSVLIIGLSIGFAAIAWLSRATVGSDYIWSVALPMVLVGVSQGLTLSPLTSSGVARVDIGDAGAASGAVNVAHQLGASVGLSILIAAAAIGAAGMQGIELTAHRVSTAFDAGTIMLAFALLIAVLSIRRAPVADAAEIAVGATLANDVCAARS
ncbi:MFS transporter [Rhizobium sp. CF142]|uniref:MFS transporter n=1 Tax=Rhizobium sp. CF142 TaxID=1144314 RepID=UPI00026EF449|nr:MFS transporter [Rhizobium sp. CF142]EJJ29495.1 arabinose efflux permease family protein [Rhizobium sp. CF142]